MASKTFNRLATKLSPWQKEQAEKYDQNTTLVYGFKYEFRDRDANERFGSKEVFVGTFVADEYGSYFDEDDGLEFFEDRIILVDGVETRIPTWFEGKRIFD